MDPTRESPSPLGRRPKYSRQLISALDTAPLLQGSNLRMRRLGRTIRESCRALEARTLRALAPTPERGAKIARVEIARKLSIAVDSMLTRGEPFVPTSPNHSLAA